MLNMDDLAENDQMMSPDYGDVLPAISISAAALRPVRGLCSAGCLPGCCLASVYRPLHPAPAAPFAKVQLSNDHSLFMIAVPLPKGPS